MNRCTERRASVAARQAALVCAALLLCPVVALGASRDPEPALARAQALVDLERALGLFVEPQLHSWLQSRPWLLAPAGAFYVWVHVPAVLGVLGWLWLERPTAFRSARNWFLATQGLVVAGYLLLPTAPPRLLDGYGFRDTLTQLWGTEAATLAHTVQSHYAAMPSGHVAFAVLVGRLLIRHGRAPWLRAVGLAYPGVVTLVVLATANHLWLDALAGLLVAMGAGWLLHAGPTASRCRSRGLTPALARSAADRPSRVASRRPWFVHPGRSRMFDLFR